jgi:hypothetical protein
MRAGPGYRALWLASLLAAAGSDAAVAAQTDAPRARGPEPEWREWIHPGDRTLHAVAYDERRSRMVLFGGRSTSSRPDDTHEWDGLRWHRPARHGPGARDGLAMVYDAGRHEVLMFGGKDLNSNGLFGDTWRWDGLAWTLAAQTGPIARERHAIGFDRERDRVVLFGGVTIDGDEGVVLLRDTWTWDGTAWTQAAGDGPTARSDAKIDYDVARERIVLYGGVDGDGNVLGDTWEWDGAAWSLASDTGPPCRVGHAMSFDATRARVVLFGGAAPCVNFPFFADQQDTWEWDGAAWERRATTGPFKRRFATLAYDRQRERSVLFGGWPAGYFPVGDGGSSMVSDLPLGDLWEWDGMYWRRRVTTVPRARYGHRMAYDVARRVTVMFGGRTSQFGYETETWEWDGDGWSRRQYAPPDTIGSVPRARGYAAMAYDRLRQRVWMFGGTQGGGAALGDLWHWDGSDWRERAATATPPALVAASMVHDEVRDRLVLFGGLRDAGPAFGETWEFDGSAWMRVARAGPPARFEAAMAYDSARARVVLFGGADGSVDFGDTWEWDGTSWTRVADTGPAPRQSAAIAYDVDRRRVVLRGGSSGAGAQLTFFDDVWEWDGASWTAAASTAAPARAGEAMVYDATRGEIVLFGGTDDYGACEPGCGNAETWLRRTVLPTGQVFEDGFESSSLRPMTH